MDLARGWALVIAASAAGCVIDDVDLAGRLCPCSPGWVCDDRSGRCVQGRADAAGAIDAALPSIDATPPCEAGTADCDRDPANGCEASLATLEHCGGCGVRCAIDRAGERCEAGVCVALACDPLFAECDGDARTICETSLATVADCGGCGVGCEIDYGMGRCEAGVCAIRRCDPGYDDCDALVENGCEADLESEVSCGACGVACGDGRRCDRGRCG